MRDIYSYNAEYSNKKIITSSEMMLFVNGGATTNVEYLIQSVSIQYNQPAGALGELGSGNRYWTTGAPMGSISVDRIIGSKPLTAVFGATAKGIWVPSSGVTCELKPVEGGTGPTYTCYGCIITQLGLDVSTQGGYCRERVSIQFGGLSIKE